LNMKYMAVRFLDQMLWEGHPDRKTKADSCLRTDAKQTP